MWGIFHFFLDSPSCLIYHFFVSKIGRRGAQKLPRLSFLRILSVLTPYQADL